MKQFFFFFSVLVSSIFASEGIGGFWKSLNDGGDPQCIFGIYEHEGIYYGRIIATYENGKIEDTIHDPHSRATGIVGNPYTCGLDILYGLQDDGYRFGGKIIDPSKGKVYNCELWREGENLIVRGKLFIFGKNITWYPVSKSDFPKGFKMPDLKKLIPAVPEVS